MRELSLHEVAHDIGRHLENQELLREPQSRRLMISKRVLVCLPSDPRRGEELLCKGWREAEEREAEWYAVHVETSEESVHKISTADFRALLDNVNLAGDLAGEFVWLKSEDVVKAIVDFARERSISKIILGRPRSNTLRGIFRPSIPGRLIREAPDFDIEIARHES